MRWPDKKAGLGVWPVGGSIFLSWFIRKVVLLCRCSWARSARFLVTFSSRKKWLAPARPRGRRCLLVTTRFKHNDVYQFTTSFSHPTPFSASLECRTVGWLTCDTIIYPRSFPSHKTRAKIWSLGCMPQNTKLYSSFIPCTLLFVA